MPLWLSDTICSIFFLVTGFLGIWAIREGGSFAFPTPSYWRKGPDGSRARHGEHDRWAWDPRPFAERAGRDPVGLPVANNGSRGGGGLRYSVTPAPGRCPFDSIPGHDRIDPGVTEYRKPLSPCRNLRRGPCFRTLISG